MRAALLKARTLQFFEDGVWCEKSLQERLAHRIHVFRPGIPVLLHGQRAV